MLCSKCNLRETDSSTCSVCRLKLLTPNPSKPHITDDDIIGNITIDDRGTQKSYNTVSTSIQDPANQFKGRAVTFYDSTYLRADKNVVKSGQINIHSSKNIRRTFFRLGS